MWTRSWWRAALERAIKTIAQTAIATIAAAVGVNLAGIADVDWVSVASVSGLAGVLSILSSIASTPVGGNSGPSLGAEELAPKVTPE